MNKPVDHGEVGKYLNETRGYPAVEMKTEYHSTWLDNTKAKFLLGWRPEHDLKRLIDSAFDYVRAEDDVKFEGKFHKLIDGWELFYKR